jgi:hypothetical protein
VAEEAVVVHKQVPFQHMEAVAAPHVPHNKCLNSPNWVPSDEDAFVADALEEMHPSHCVLLVPPNEGDLKHKQIKIKANADLLANADTCKVEKLYTV